MAVVALAGLAVAEDDAAGHGVRALDVGVVEALDVAWLDVEAEVLLHALHDAPHAPVGVKVLLLLLAVLHIAAHVAQAHLEHFSLIPPGGYGKPHAGKLHVGEEGHDNFGETALEASADLADGHGEDLLAAGLELAAAVFEIEALHHRAVVQVHEVDESCVVALLVGEDVHVLPGGSGNEAPGVVALHQGHLLLELLGLLELEAFGGYVHLVAQESQQHAGLTVENLAHALHRLPILIFVDEAAAGTLALLDVVVEAETEFSLLHRLPVDEMAAGAERIDVSDKV